MHPNRPGSFGGLLSEGLLEGQYEVSTALRPERLARPLAVDDMAAALEEVARLCQVWGGAGHPLLPVGPSGFPAGYRRLLDQEQFDGVGGLQDLRVDLPSRVDTSAALDFPAAFIAAHRRRDEWRPIQVCDLAEDDPWRAAYAAVLGWLPALLSPALASLHFVREDFAYDEVVPLERQAVVGSLDDLARRASDTASMTPRQFANAFLASGQQPDTSYFGPSENVLPTQHEQRRATGPNIVVALSPDSVEDLCLLWNLRAAHGDRGALPIGVPRAALDAKALRRLQEPGRAVRFGLGGGGLRLVSASVGVDDLKETASAVPSVKVLESEELLAWGPAPSRYRSHVSTWTHGRTRVDPLSDADREVLAAATGPRRPSLVLDVRVPAARLPSDPTMRGTDVFGRYQAGAAQVTVSELRRQDTVEVLWPSSWTCLAAVAQSHGFDVRESQPGLAARTLLEALSDVDQAYLFANHDLIALLYRMAEVSGMSWWKRRWASKQRELVEQGGDSAAVEQAAVLLGRDDPVVAPAGEGRAVPFQEFVRALASEDAALHWVSWAERRHLLVRGADVKCDGCGAPTWLPMAAVPPPVICAACGREIRQPYGPRHLRFTYRLGEPIRRVLETDSLGHVLALRWLVELFGDRSLVGAHPGVEFLDPSTRRTVREVDVVLLFSDGSLVPVEVKRTGAGVGDDNEQAMDETADALGATWDVLVVTEPARECADVESRGRRLPQRPRLLLTTDQLFEDLILWTMGADPFSWDPIDVARETKRASDFCRGLAANDPDRIPDRVAQALLDRSLVAYRDQPDEA